MKQTLIIAALATVFTFGLSAQAQSKIGFVDMQKAIQATAAGKKAKTELESEFNKKKKEIEKKDADLKKLGEDLEKKKSVLSEEALSKKQGEFQDEMLKFREAVEKSRLEIQKKEQELTSPILEKMKKVIAKVAKDKGFSMVLENNQMILYSAADGDLTEEVVKAFEK